MVIDLLAPAATSPTLQVTFCPLVLQLAEVPVIVRPFGMVSVMVTLVAVLPPTLDASIVNVSESPEFTEVLLALFVTFTSGCGQLTFRVTVLLVLLPVLPAGSLAALTVAVLLTDGHAASVSFILFVADLLAPAARPPRLPVAAWPLVLQLAEVPVIVKPAGTVSLIWTLVAVAAPMLDA